MSRMCMTAPQRGCFLLFFRRMRFMSSPRTFRAKQGCSLGWGKACDTSKPMRRWHRALRRESCERQGGMLGMRCCTHRCQMILRLVLRYTGSFGMSWRGLLLRMPV